MNSPFPPSDHYRDGRFFNPGVPEHGLAQMMRWVTNRERGRWRRRIPSEPGPAPVERVEGSQLRVTLSTTPRSCCRARD